MRMKSCKQCEDIISTTDEICENCGAANATKKGISMLWVATLALPLVALIMVFKSVIT
ncbi:MAG: hypothetical protein AB8B92_07025 [Gammaproteobacteria bacterium]